MALADQAAGHAHGFSNPAFYSLAGSGAFTDVRNPAATVAVLRGDFVNAVDGATTTSLRTMNQALSLKATPRLRRRDRPRHPGERLHRCPAEDVSSLSRREREWRRWHIPSTGM